MRPILIPSLLMLMAANCTEYDTNRRSKTDTFTQEPSSKVDILWVIDNSVSMEGEQQRVAEGFDSFIANIDETNIDFHIGVVSTDLDLDNPSRGQLIGDPPYLTSDDDYVGEFESRVRVGTDGSDKEKGLGAAVDAVTEPLASGANLGFVRSEADLLIIFVSDEDDCSDDNALANQSGSACYEQRDQLVEVADLVDQLKAVKAGTGKRVIASAIVGPHVDEACAQSWPGHRYWRAAEYTGGLIGNICDDDYGSIMGNLGLSVAGVLTTFQLSCSADADSISVLVDGEEVPNDPVVGWTYDSDFWMVRFDGTYVPPRGTTISVEYFVSGSCGEPDPVEVEDTASGG
ncbi:MAG: VWA domain-containing protein [Alphaproteobacteria bacterium]|nr:VWA domain-containing protein [Alphaproteobacteria bacterium]MCB9796639.1 VWA domain-containing protein [Alphaproteobacteria bacterium]